MRKFSGFVIFLIGSILLMSATLFFSVPEVSVREIPCLSDIPFLVENVSAGSPLLRKVAIRLCMGLLYALGCGILAYGDAKGNKEQNSKEINFLMVMVSFSAVVMTAVRFLLYLQHGIAAGFGVVLIMKMIAYFVLFLFAVFGLKDEIEMHLS